MITTTVYVRLLDEGIEDVFRPTKARIQPDGYYKLLPTQGYDPEDEHWEFLPGQLVRCETMKLDGGMRLVATANV